MAVWDRNKVDSTQLNSGNQYDSNSQFALDEMNAIVNGGLYSQDFAEHLADTPDNTLANQVGTAEVEVVDNVVGGKTYKKFKFKNLKGVQGEQGIQIQGEQGIKGEQGLKGEQGIQGEQGIKGEQGLKGEQGIQGEQGIKGEQGLKGDKGDTGAGVVIGGTVGQILKKKSADDYDTEWDNEQDISEKVDKIYSTNYAYTEGLVFTWDTDHYEVGDGTSNPRNAYPIGTETNIVIPKYYDDGTHGIALVTEIRSYSFKGFSSLISIDIPNSITNMGSHTFEQCINLKYITIPDNVTHIGSGVFDSCTSLTSIIIPNRVTTFGVNSFYDCDGLISITIPDSVTNMGSGAFVSSSNLISATINSSIPPILNSAPFFNTGISATTGAIYVPYESLTAYKTATDWSTYANRIYPIPDGKDLTDRLDLKLDTSLKGANNGLAELDATGKVPSAQLPSYVDDIIEVANYASLPVTGEDGKIYVTLDTNLAYRWGGSAYVEISLALGETSSTAYRGDKGKTAYDHSQLTSGNPHNVTKTNVGLSNVYNPTAYGGISYGGGAGESGVSFTDLDSLVYTGFYTCFGTTARVPSASYSWFIEHINSNVGTTSAIQIATAYATTTIIYIRHKISSTWGAWENISPSLKVDKVAGKELSTNDLTNTLKSNYDTAYTNNHTHSNKALLDTYTQTEVNLADAVSKKHTHSNKTILDNTTASYTTDEQTKLLGIANGAQVNIIEEIKVNNTALIPTAKSVNITIPVQASDVNALPDTTKYGATIDLSYTANTGVLGLVLKDQDGTQISSDSVDLPLELLIESGSVKTCTVVDTPVVGYVIGDKYIDLVLANSNHIYIKVSDLIDQVTITETGTGNAVTDISISGNTITETKGKTFVETNRKVNGHALSSDITITKSDVGLENCDNTSDINKPVSTAQATALDLKVDKVSGKELSTNDLTNTLKSNYDTAYTNTHTHSNKALLDNTTASYTTAEQTKLGAISGTNTGDETASTIKTKLGITTLSGSNTGDQTLPVNSDFTLSGLSEKKFSSLTSKPTTIAGYGITNAYTKTEVDSKVASVYKYKGNVANYASLPTIGLTIGDVYNVEDTGDNYAWTGTVWDKLAGAIDLSGYVLKTTTVNGHALCSNVTVTKSDVGLGNVDNTSDTNKPVSTAQATAIALKVDKTSIKNAYDNSTTAIYSSKYIEDNFAQMLYTTIYYANKVTTTSANLTSTIPTLSASNYLSSTTTNTAFNWTTPNFVFTNTLTGNLSLQASSLIYLSLPFSISLASQTVNFGYRVKMNGVAISSNQTFGAVAYTGGSGHTTVNRVYLQCTTDSLTEKTIYGAGDAVSFEVFTQQATSTSMTTRTYCGCSIGEVDYYTFNELAQFKSQLGEATPTNAGTVYGQTSVSQNNVSLGYNALNNNIQSGLDGKDNTAVGYNSLKTITNGLSNTAIGCNSLEEIINGNFNTAIGSGSLSSTDNSYYNTAIGCFSLSNSVGKRNTGIGYSVLYNNITGYNNTSIGYNSLCNNITGYNNTSIGYNSLYNNTYGYYNVAIGSESLLNNTEGEKNVVIGSSSLRNNILGSNNISIGTNAGKSSYNELLYNLTDISNSILIGSETKSLNATGDTNEIVIGYNATGHGSNTATWGNTNIISHYFTGNIKATGDIIIQPGKTLRINDVDALFLKLDKVMTGSLRRVYGVTTNNVQELIQIETAPVNGSTKLVDSNGIYDALALKANLASPALTGTPTAPTASAGTNTTQLATTAFVKTLGDTKAKVDASNLTSGNVTSWQNKLETKLYRHSINSNQDLNAIIINKSSTLFTASSLASFLYSNGYIQNNKVYSCSGLYSNGTQWLPVYGMFSTNGTTLTRVYSNYGNVLTGTISTISDNVQQI